ncbi:MAG: hypothetical protein JRN46_02230 [Nitrososphaerota archaeon]|nr:hypothetical protein [Nitrososphaerota archaeon]
MNHRTALAILGATFLAFSFLPISAGATTQSTSSTNSSLTVTVGPVGSLTLAGKVVTENYSTPGTVPSVTASASVSSSGGQSVAKIQATATLPAADTKNITGSVSGHGTYGNDKSSGTITISGSPGINNPTSTIDLTYSGTATTVTAQGTFKVTYGTYTFGTQTVEITEANVSQLVSIYQSQFNTTRINAMLAQSPIYAAANVTATAFTITNTPGSSYSTVTVDLGLSGNFTALPGAEVASLCTRSSASACAAGASLLNAIDNAVTGYTYSFGYSSGTITFDATVTGPTNFNLNSIAQAEVRSSESSGNFTSAQKAFLSSTTFDISGLSFSAQMNQSSTGLVNAEFKLGGLVLNPRVTVTSGQFNESGFFSSFGSAPANLTVRTSGGGKLTIPPGVPAPVSQTATSATWVNVNGSALAPMTFSVGTVTTQSAGSQTSGTASTTSGNSIPEFPLQSAAAFVLVAVVLTAYLLTRRSLASRGRTLLAPH